MLPREVYWGASIVFLRDFSVRYVWHALLRQLLHTVTVSRCLEDARPCTPPHTVFSSCPQPKILYTAPTLIRSLMQHGDAPVLKVVEGRWDTGYKMFCSMSFVLPFPLLKV